MVKSSGLLGTMNLISIKHIFNMNELIYQCLTIPVPNSLSLSSEFKEFEMREIVVIGTWASWKLPGRRFKAFTSKNLASFQSLVEQAEKIVGFNSARWQKLLVETYGFNIITNFDLLYEILGKTLHPDFKERLLTGEYYYEEIFVPSLSKYSLLKFAKANLRVKSFMTDEEISFFWVSGKQKKVIQQALYQVKQLKRLKNLYEQQRLYDPFCYRPVGYQFIIPIPTITCYQKIVAFGLGALFRPDGNYAFLCRFKDYEHYALLCCNRDE